MPKVKQFDKQTAKLFHQDFNAAMVKFAEKYGLRYRPANSRFDPYSGEFRTKVEFVIPGTVDNRQVTVIDDYSGAFVKMGSKFVQGRDEYEIVDYVPRRYKYPVTAKRLRDGKLFKFSDRVLKKAH